MPFDPKYSITAEINKSLIEIERVRGFLDAIKIKEDWARDMRAKALVLEAHHSTHIEGTALTLSQANDILSGKKIENVRRDDERELLNYKKAMNFIATYLGKDDPVTEALIRHLHKLLVSNVRGGEARPGSYRKIQNYIANSRTKKIIYTPPSSIEVPFLMQDFVNWVNNNINKISPILIAGISQFQFVHIHPFVDGNGRSARLLSTLILYKTGYDFKRLFTISEYYDKDRSAYYSAIQSVRNNEMDMTVWLEYFVEGLHSQMKEIKIKGERIIKRDIVLQKIEKKGINPRQEKAVKYLIQNDRMTVKDYVSVTSCIRRTAQRDLEDLVGKKIIIAMAKSSTDPTKYFVLL